MPFNPCVSCGACCAFFRASFYWGETDAETPNGVPAALTEDLTAFRVVMRGTNQPSPRCVALLGDIGRQVGCSIYERRSTVCRAFDPSYMYGEHNVDCDRARLLHGMTPLTPEDYLNQDPEGEPSDPTDCPIAPAA